MSCLVPVRFQPTQLTVASLKVFKYDEISFLPPVNYSSHKDSPEEYILNVDFNRYYKVRATQARFYCPTATRCNGQMVKW
jgi:hypothetical protein